MAVLALLACLATPIAQAPANVGMAELGPDGRRVLFTKGTSGSYELFATTADGSTLPELLSAPLVPFGSVISAAFSPGGERIVYAADQDVNDVIELYSVPSAGGAAPVKLHTPLGVGRSVRPLAPGASWFALTPDGTRVVFGVDTGASTLERVELFSAPIDGSSAAVLLSTPLVSGGNVIRFHMSADGQRVAFVADASVNDDFEVLVAPVDGSLPPLLLSTLGNDVSRAEFSPDSTRVVYAAPEAYSVLSDGSAAPILLGPHTGVYEFRFTPDSQRVVYRNSGQLVNAPLDGSSPGIELTSSINFAQSDLTPDGTRSVFIATDILGYVNLYSRPIDGSAPAKRLAMGSISQFRISPDGSRVAFCKGDVGCQLKAVDVLGSEPVRLLSSDNVSWFLFVPGRAHVVFETTDVVFPSTPQLFQAPASGALPAFPLGSGRIKALGADRPKRTASELPTRLSSRTGVLLFAAPVVSGDVGLFAQPWDGSDPAVRLDP